MCPSFEQTYQSALLYTLSNSKGLSSKHVYVTFTLYGVVFQLLLRTLDCLTLDMTTCQQPHTWEVLVLFRFELYRFFSTILTISRIDFFSSSY